MPCDCATHLMGLSPPWFTEAIPSVLKQENEYKVQMCIIFLKIILDSYSPVNKGEEMYAYSWLMPVLSLSWLLV